MHLKGLKDRVLSPCATSPGTPPRGREGAVAVPVSDYVGNPRNKEPRCTAPTGNAVTIPTETQVPAMLHQEIGFVGLGVVRWPIDGEVTVIVVEGRVDSA